MKDASWNQKYNLYKWAKDKNYPTIYAELEARNILAQPMSEWRYKKIRNAILYNNPQYAIKLLMHYPIDFRGIDVAPRGGEL